jgi:hypothetical protein
VRQTPGLLNQNSQILSPGPLLLQPRPLHYKPIHERIQQLPGQRQRLNPRERLHIHRPRLEAKEPEQQADSHHHHCRARTITHQCIRYPRVHKCLQTPPQTRQTAERRREPVLADSTGTWDLDEFVAKLPAFAGAERALKGDCFGGGEGVAGGEDVGAVVAVRGHRAEEGEHFGGVAARAEEYHDCRAGFTVYEPWRRRGGKVGYYGMESDL